ncbi:MAG: hypothetical protein GX424_06660 [Clostridiales bacterium]|nr:hypothetical protein [Clostridiales bacterium]
MTGTLLVTLSAFSFLKYRPLSRDGRGLCALAALMGLLAAGAGGGNWRFQLIQTLLMAVVGFCCVARARGESVLRARRAMRRRLHRPQRGAAEQPARSA